MLESRAIELARQFRPGDVLLIVDVQQDFLPGGALAVAGGDRVIGPLNHGLDRFARANRPVFLTRDWHPLGHCSFRAQGGPWPPHCVAGTQGAAFAPALRVPEGAHIVSKGALATQEAYSGFAGTDLEARLRDEGGVRLFVGGLATDYCVLQTVLDALERRFQVVVLRDAVAAVEARAGDGQRALARMAEAGAQMAQGDLSDWVERQCCASS